MTFPGTEKWQSPQKQKPLTSASFSVPADLETHGTRSQNDIQHRIAELLPAGGAPIAQLVCHPVLVAVLRQYLGNRFRCATFSSNTLLPQGPRCCASMHVANIVSMLQH